MRWATFALRRWSGSKEVFDERFQLNSVYRGATMSGLQKFFSAIFPSAWAADMEAESRKWIQRCQECGYSVSIWDLGGIRWKATGNPRRMTRCQKCGKSNWHTITKEPD